MIDVLYCGNSGVFDGVLTSMLSIFKRSRKDDFRFFVFTMDLTRYKESYTPISDELISFLDQVAKHYGENNVVKKIDVTALYEKEMGRSPNEGAYCSPYTLLRLLADLVPEVDGEKLLYLDCDILFNRDIHLLYEQDVEGVEYAAARDHYGKFLLYPNYINAGVLLFNMTKCRETGLFPKTRVWINKKKLTFADQSALVRSTTKKKMLPQKFNDQKFLHKSTVVRHFSKRLFYLPYPHTDNIKQWHVDKVHRVFKYHVFDDILSEYLALKDEYLAGKDAYGGK